jgi:hypothetical protein
MVGRTYGHLFAHRMEELADRMDVSARSAAAASAADLLPNRRRAVVGL